MKWPLETVVDPAKSSDMNKFAAAMHLWYVVLANVCEENYFLDQVPSEWSCVGSTGRLLNNLKYSDLCNCKAAGPTIHSVVVVCVCLENSHESSSSGC